jgi:transposase-like protein
VTKKSTPLLSRLLDDVERLCSNKAALARRLKVTPSHLQKWITAREYEPGGEITLRLQKWVKEAKEAKQKSPGSAQTPPEPKAQLSNPSYEKTKSGRKKS